jgi:hypothetical protein
MLATFGIDAASAEVLGGQDTKATGSTRAARRSSKPTWWSWSTGVCLLSTVSVWGPSRSRVAGAIAVDSSCRTSARSVRSG